MSIIRRKKTKNYSILNNGALQNPKLSCGAKGLYAYLMTLPDDWVVRKTELPRHFKDGSKMIYARFKELSDAGYIDEKVTLVKGLKKYSYTVNEFPSADVAERHSSSDTRPATLAEGQLLNTEETRTKEEKTEEEKTEREEKPPFNGIDPASLQFRAGSLMRYTSRRRWDKGEKTAWTAAKEIVQETTDEQWKALERFYAAPQNETYSRKNLSTLLNNWNGEVEKAIQWCAENPPSPPAYSDYVTKEEDAIMFEIDEAEQRGLPVPPIPEGYKKYKAALDEHKKLNVGVDNS